MKTILSAQANGSGSWLKLGNVSAFECPVSASGTWGGATATLEVSLDGGTTLAPAATLANGSAAFTADGSDVVLLPERCWVRGTVAGGGGTEEIDLVLQTR